MRTYEAPRPLVHSNWPHAIDDYIDRVLSFVPDGEQRQRIDLDLRSRVARGEDASRFADPRQVAESYLAAVPLVSAPFFSRVAAALIDIPSVILSGFGLFYVSWKLVSRGDQSFIAAILSGNPVAMALGFAALICMSPLYYVVLESTTTQTVGKWLLGLRVVRESGAKISVGQAIVRQIPLFFSFYVLDALFALFTEKKQRAFELISKTRVVRA